MITIWKEGGTLERLGVVAYVLSFVACFVDLVDFEALPKGLDKLAVSLPLAFLATVLVLGGQKLRHRAEERRRED